MKEISILLVEDQAIILRSFQELLKMLGYNDISTALDPTRALEISAEKNINLLITDYALPEMNGLELAWKISHLMKLETIPTIVISGSRMEDIEQEARRIFRLNACCVRILSKPLDPKSLAKNIEEMFPSS